MATAPQQRRSAPATPPPSAGSLPQDSSPRGVKTMPQGGSMTNQGVSPAPPSITPKQQGDSTKPQGGSPKPQSDLPIISTSLVSKPQNILPASSTSKQKAVPSRVITSLPPSSPFLTRMLWSMFCILILLSASAAEEVFHRRYHEDQSVLNPPSHKMVIRNKDQALEYLEKYGYLSCGDDQPETVTVPTPVGQTSPSTPLQFEEGTQNRRHKRRAAGLIGELLSPREDVEPAHVRCPTENIANAVRQFQKAYNIEQTGILDRKTIVAMNMNRCGNSDAALEDSTHTFEKAVEKAQRQSPPAHRGTKRRRRALDILQKREELRIREARSLDHLKRNGLLHSLLRDGSHPHKMQSIRRRRELMKEFKEKIEREPVSYSSKVFPDESVEPDVVIDGRLDEPKLDTIRKKRSAPIKDDINIANSKAFNKKTVTWRLLTTSFSSHIPTSDQRATLQLAFRMWSEVIPIIFEESNDDTISQVDIRIAFVKRKHLMCAKNFDGTGGSIAHSWIHGDIHFDDEENYKGAQIEAAGGLANKAFDGVLLLKVAVHEIGHVLGLDHTSRRYSVMFAIYNPLPSLPEEGEFELGWEDRKYVQNIYGCCKGKFDTIFDWVRPMASGALVYNTYLFRNSIYWLYENRYNRTRYGDPLLIKTGWRGVPNNVDSFAQVVYTFKAPNRTDTVYILEAFFFQGDIYYKYDHEHDQVAESYPRQIADDFSPMASNATGYAGTLPSNIDSVFYHSMNNKLYFFKADMVYIIDYVKYVQQSPDAGCCDMIGTFTEIFPPAPNEENPLEGYITSVYYSYGEKTLFFFKDEDVWQDENFPDSPRVRYIGKWYEKWFDICEA